MVKLLTVIFSTEKETQNSVYKFCILITNELFMRYNTQKVSEIFVSNLLFQKDRLFFVSELMFSC